ncbi:nucleotidyltransferase domain-containing protein [Vibrio sp. D173a]|uniref:nucleotidyltransferase domain-containing protein n=1 Tax=Vibrio sp. D173a TaxID=2836349 RepID=UPI0025535FDE|nr:nucleotidyltransferase domain-containing protein [Vibrio sp. D173a]MDK9759110.1 nucleotidyltransferase domain-containing protein [Vibrio sp. D173a]
MQLPVIDPKVPFQPEFQPVVNDLITFLKSGLGSNLHSVYIYGSVARKTAKPGQSNLDVVVVTHRSFADQRTTLLNTIKWRFQKSFPQVTQVSIKTALVSEIVDFENIFTWGFMLKHLAVCVHGEDLSDCYGDFETSWEIAKHWNMDVENWLAVYRNKIARAATPEEQIAAQVIITKKLLRASYSLIMYRDKYWYDDPLECGQQFLKYHPDREVEIQRLGILLAGKPVPNRSVIGILDGFGEWLVKQYEKTEFSIG